MIPVLIFGASSLGCATASILSDQEAYKPIGFIDDACIPARADDLPHLGSTTDLERIMRELSVNHGIIAIGDNTNRRIVHKKIVTQSKEFNFINAIHPRATVLGKVRIGHGNIIFPGVVISSGSQIGDFSIINSNATIGAHSHIADFSNIGPGANIGARSTVGTGTSIGMGANVKQLITTGNNCVIGAGAVVVENVGNGLIVAGVPAKEI
jgi:sugar O-acyltransferase (sialic acid O-acetyltransferase NeuD family)